MNENYVRPSLDLLDDYPEEIQDYETQSQIALAIEEVYKECGITLSGMRIIRGAKVTRYDIRIFDSSKITMALKQKNAIAKAIKKYNITLHIDYYRGCLALFVPNEESSTVGLKSVLESKDIEDDGKLTFALGNDTDGKAVCCDLKSLHHILIGGISGSGKSSFLDSMIISLMYRYSPEELRFIIVDPKQLDFTAHYNGMPHLLTGEIINDADKALGALNWAVNEMERRYALFKDMSVNGTNARGGEKTEVHNIDGYNGNLADGVKKLQEIVIIIDEFGYLMLRDKKRTENLMIKLVQKSLYCGIHLVAATQMLKYISSAIKNFFQTRIAFKTLNMKDSYRILDSYNAEILTGGGDMYFCIPGNHSTERIQGCYVNDGEIKIVTDFVRENNTANFENIDFGREYIATEMPTTERDGIDDVYIRALRFCIEAGKASVSLLQRRFPIGYMKSCKIIDWMEDMNYITKADDAGKRKVLMTLEEFIDTYGDIE